MIRIRSGLIASCALFLMIGALVLSCSKKENPTPATPGILQLQKVRAGNLYLDLGRVTTGVPVDRNFVLQFSNPLDTTGMPDLIVLEREDSSKVAVQISYLDNNSSVALDPAADLDHGKTYRLVVSSGLRGAGGETFAGFTLSFVTQPGNLSIASATLNGKNFYTHVPLVGIGPDSANIRIRFSVPLNPDNYKSFISLSGTGDYTLTLSDDSLRVSLSTVTLLQTFKKYTFTISQGLTAANGFTFEGFSNAFYGALDSVYQYPVISDDALLTKIQEQTFAYFWDYAHPGCGMARERLGSGDVVTTGGSGFGVMALIVGVERGFITRDQALQRMDKILTFLETCDRFHGAWPHWLNGANGKTVPFSPDDNGGDLVETSFMIQGLLTFRQYLQASVPAEKDADRPDQCPLACRGIRLLFHG